MAIIKDLETEYGITLKYHVITSFTADYNVEKYFVNIGSYASEENYINKQMPVKLRSLEVKFSDVDSSMQVRDSLESFLGKQI